MAWVARDLGSTRPGSRTTRVAHGLSPQPGPPAAWVACDLGEKNPGSSPPRSRATQASHCLRFSVLGSGFFWFYFFIFFFFSGFSLICFGFFSIFIRVVNQVLETRFPCGHHVEKYATLAWKEFESKRLNL